MLTRWAKQFDSGTLEPSGFRYSNWGTLYEMCHMDSKTLAPLLVIGILSGCAQHVLPNNKSVKLVQPQVIEADSDYALVIFLRPWVGDDMGGGVTFGLWDSEDLVGFLPSGRYVQYKANPGEHIFLTQDKRNWAVAKANLLAGRTYYVVESSHNAWWGMAINVLTLWNGHWWWVGHRVSLEIIKPDGKKSSDLIAALKPIDVDPAQRDTYAKDWVEAVRQAIEEVRNGRTKFSVINPEDGR